MGVFLLEENEFTGARGDEAPRRGSVGRGRGGGGRR